jgi:hypothetical protein
LTTAPSTGPSSARASFTAASSPEIIATGTRKCPAIAAFKPASGTETPFSRTSARVAEDIVWARTPSGYVVEAW